MLIIVVVTGYGVARLRLATLGVLVVLMFFLYGVGPFYPIPAAASTKRVVHLLDKSYSARPLAERNREVVNYEDTGVPVEQHLLVARVTGRRGVDLRTPAALQEYLEGRHYEELLNWPEQGLEVYLVGAR